DDNTIRSHHISNQNFVFEKINEDGNDLSPVLLSFSNDPILSDIMTNAANELVLHNDYFAIELDVQCTDSTCYLFDHAVGLLETTITIRPKHSFPNRQTWKSFFELVQEKGNVIMEYLIKHYYERKITVVLTQIHKL